MTNSQILSGRQIGFGVCSASKSHSQLASLWTLFAASIFTLSSPFWIPVKWVQVQKRKETCLHKNEIILTIGQSRCPWALPKRQMLLRLLFSIGAFLISANWMDSIIGSVPFGCFQCDLWQSMEQKWPQLFEIKLVSGGWCVRENKGLIFMWLWYGINKLAMHTHKANSARSGFQASTLQLFFHVSNGQYAQCKQT